MKWKHLSCLTAAAALAAVAATAGAAGFAAASSLDQNVAKQGDIVKVVTVNSANLPEAYAIGHAQTPGGALPARHTVAFDDNSQGAANKAGVMVKTDGGIGQVGGGNYEQTVTSGARHALGKVTAQVPGGALPARIVVASVTVAVAPGADLQPKFLSANPVAPGFVSS